MAAVLARGETVISNAAREPEVQDLADLLTKMGAKIEGAGTSTIQVQGVEKLQRYRAYDHPGPYRGRNVSACRRDLKGRSGGHRLRSRAHRSSSDQNAPGGCGGRRSRRRSAGSLPAGGPKSVDMTTEEYPGFATDLQAQYMAWMATAQGISFVTETIFENRFMHVLELVRMGANIRIEGRQAIVAGEERLMGTQVIASDLRASASLVLAALVAQGETTIHRVYHMDRGYERIEQKLASVGAKIERVQ